MVQLRLMPYSFSSNFQRMLLLGTRNFLNNNSIDDLTFDTVILPNTDIAYKLGEELHFILTTPLEIKSDRDAQLKIIETLKGLNVTYDVLLANTIRARSDVANPHRVTDGIEIAEPVNYIDQAVASKVENPQPKPQPKKAPTTPKPKKKTTQSQSRNGKPTSEPTAPPTNQQPNAVNVISVEDAIAKYVHWFRSTSENAINYALRVCIEIDRDKTKKPPEKVSVGSIPVNRKEFIAVMQTLLRSGNLSNPGLKPALELKTQTDEIMEMRRASAQNTIR